MKEVPSHICISRDRSWLISGSFSPRSFRRSDFFLLGAVIGHTDRALAPGVVTQNEIPYGTNFGVIRQHPFLMDP